MRGLTALAIALIFILMCPSGVKGQTDTPSETPTPTVDVGTGSPAVTETLTETPTATATPIFGQLVALPSGGSGATFYTVDAGELVIIAFLVVLTIFSGIQVYLGVRNDIYR